MKKWENVEIVEVALADTQNGGEPSMNFDQMWFDNTGALHVNFES